MEKFVLTPIKVFDKIAKYSPENAKIELLLKADNAMDRVENDSSLDPVTKSFLSSLKRKDIELYRKKVFPPEEYQTPINSNNLTDNENISKKEITEIKGNEKKDNNDMEGDAENDEDKFQLPPLNTSHTNTIGPDQKYIIDQLKNDPTFELHDNQTFTLGKKTHRNINDTLNHITRSRTSTRMQPVDGTEAILRSLGVNNEKLNLNKISLRSDVQDKIKQYQMKAKNQEQISTKTKGGAAEQNKLIFIDKLPFIYNEL